MKSARRRGRRALKFRTSEGTRRSGAVGPSGEERPGQALSLRVILIRKPVTTFRGSRGRDQPTQFTDTCFGIDGTIEGDSNTFAESPVAVRRRLTRRSVTRVTRTVVGSRQTGSA